MKKISRAIFFFVHVICCLGHFAHAQTPVSTGVVPFGSYEGGPDLVNLGNLNVHLDIPIVHKAGRMLNFSYNLGYDSASSWAIATGYTGAAVWSPSVFGGGWNPETAITSGDPYYIDDSYGVTPYHEANETVSNYSYSCTAWNGESYSSSIGPEGYTAVFSDFEYFDVTGRSHTIPGSITVAVCGGYGVYTYSGFGTATDGSGISAFIDPTVYPQNGTTPPIVQYIVPSHSPQSPSYTTTNFSTYGTEYDRNGNEIVFKSTGSAGDFLSGYYTDTTGQVALTVANSNSGVTFTYPNGSGGTSQAFLHYAVYPIQTNFGCGASEYSGSARLPDYLLLADGLRYSFTYVSTGSGSVNGQLQTVTLPSGGTVSYQYAGPLCDGTYAGLVRTVNDANGNTAQWSYTRSAQPGATSLTVATDPQEKQKNLAFWIGASGNYYETSRQEYDTTGTLQRTVLTDSGTTEPITQRNVQTMLPDATGIASEVSTSYDFLANPLSITALDYGAPGQGPGSMLFQKNITYDTVDGAFDQLFQEVYVAPVSNGPPMVIVTTNLMDTAPLVATSGLSQQYSGLPSNRGNPTNTSVCGFGVGAPANCQSISRTFYDTGELATITDTNGQTTSYSYSQCNGAYPTSTSLVVQPSSVALSTSASWNCSGGVPNSTTDVNGNVTSYTYADPSWRPTNIADGTGNSVAIAYPTSTSNSTSVSVSMAGGIPTSRQITTYDGLGRKILSQAQDAPGTSYVSSATTYNVMGAFQWTSIPYTGQLGQYITTGSGTTFSYDSMGRLQSVLDAGGGQTSYTYAYNDVNISQTPAPSGENPKSRQLEYDAAGHLLSVCELTGGSGSGACGQTVSATGYLTTYSYAGSMLESVSQNAQAGSPSIQNRLLSYDQIGRKVSETIPETGSSYFTYDSDGSGACPGTYPGDMVKSVDNAGNTTCFTYDSLHRLLSAQVVSGVYASVTPQTKLVYDQATFSGTAMQNVKGALAEAYTCNNPCTNKLTDIFISSFLENSTSGPTGRRIAQLWESTPSSNGYFSVQADVNSNGTPSGVAATLNGNPFGFPSVVYGLDEAGRLHSASAILPTANGTTTLPLVSSVGYNSYDVVTGIAFSNGDNDSFGHDPLTGRPTSFAYSVNGQNAFSITGGLTWNANGSLQNFQMVDSSDASKNQNCNYSLDDLNRLASVNCAGSWAQNFAYDPFGNISKWGPSNPQPGQITQTYAAGYSSLNNQAVSGVTAAYDANGNQTTTQTSNLGWNAAAQPVKVDGVNATYDAMGRLVETNNGGVTTQYVYSPGGQKLGSVQNGQLVRGLVPLPGGASAVFDSSGLSYFRHTDWLGSSRLATTWDHEVYSKEAYAPFGETYNEAGTPDRSFTGQDANSAGGYDFLFRKYDPVAGRWLSPDPLGWGAVNPAYPQSLNRYAYVQNNPMSNVDPDGQDCVYAGTDNISAYITPGQCPSQEGQYVPGTITQVAFTNGQIDTVYYVDYGQAAFGDYSVTDTESIDATMGTGGWGGADASVATEMSPSSGLSPYIAATNPFSSYVAPDSGPHYSNADVCGADTILKNGVSLFLDGLSFLAPEGELAETGFNMTLGLFATVNSAVNGDLGGAGLGITGFLHAPINLNIQSISEGGTVAKASTLFGKVLPFASAVYDYNTTANDYNECMGELSGH